MADIKKEIKEWIISILIAAALAIVIKSYVFDIIQVSGTSMVPTLHDNDRVAVEKISLITNNIKRQEIIIFDSGSRGRGIYIKRVIGIAGDEIEIKNGNVYLNGEALKENYLKPGTYTDNDVKIKVPEGYVYVLGDNREVSEDSRYIGPVPITKIKGRALLRLYPFNDVKKF